MPKTSNPTLIIRGRIPSKKNSRLLFVQRGRLMNIPSKQYAAWHKLASSQILEFKDQLIEDIDHIELDFYAPDRRGTDLTNKAESIMDLLVDNGIIKDDNWWIVSRLVLNFMGVDKAYPRCSVYIHRKTNGN
jgi:hypothetical protein